jgi:hypothetical protein
MEDEKQVQGLHEQGGRLIAAIGQGKHHVEKIAAIIQGRIGIFEGHPDGFFVTEGGDGAHLADEFGSGRHKGVRVPGSISASPDGREAAALDRGGEDGHGIAVRGQGVEKFQHPLVEDFLGRQKVPKIKAFLQTGEVAVDQEPRRRHIIHVGHGQVVDVVPPVTQDAPLSVDIRDGRIAAPGAHVSRIARQDAVLPVEVADVDGQASLRPLDDPEGNGGKPLDFQFRVSMLRHVFCLHPFPSGQACSRTAQASKMGV